MSLIMRDDALDLLGVEHVVGQVVVDLGVGQVAALLAQHDQGLQARAALLGVFLRQLASAESASASLPADFIRSGLPLSCFAWPRRPCCFEQLERRALALLTGLRLLGSLGAAAFVAGAWRATAFLARRACARLRRLRLGVLRLLRRDACLGAACSAWRRCVLLGERLLQLRTAALRISCFQHIALTRAVLAKSRRLYQVEHSGLRSAPASSIEQLRQPQRRRASMLGDSPPRSVSPSAALRARLSAQSASRASLDLARSPRPACSAPLELAMSR